MIIKLLLSTLLLYPGYNYYYYGDDGNKNNKKEKGGKFCEKSFKRNRFDWKTCKEKHFSVRGCWYWFSLKLFIDEHVLLKFSLNCPGDFLTRLRFCFLRNVRGVTFSLKKNSTCYAIRARDIFLKEEALELVRGYLCPNFIGDP